MWSGPGDLVVNVESGDTGPRFGEVACGCRLIGLTGNVMGEVRAVGVLGVDEDVVGLYVADWRVGADSVCCCWYLVAGSSGPKPCELLRFRVTLVGNCCGCDGGNDCTGGDGMTGTLAGSSATKLPEAGIGKNVGDG